MISALSNRELEAIKALLEFPLRKEVNDTICEIELHCGLGIIIMDIDKLPDQYKRHLGLPV
jgi:hypothetical protein